MRGYQNNRLLIVAPSAYTLGGLATWLDYLMPGLRERGWEATLGLVAGSRHHRPAEYLRQHPDANSISITCRTGTRTGRVRAIRRAVRQVRPDIVLSVNIPDALLGTMIERQGGADVRAVMTCHGIQPDLFGDMRLLAAGLDAVVCTNRLACRLATKTGGIEPDLVHYATYGTNVPDASRVSPDDGVFRVAYVGRLEQDQKRVADLPQIATSLRQSPVPFRFLVVGDGPERETLESLITGAGLDEQFEMLGRVPESEIAGRVLGAADALIVCSAWETGPIVIREAMAQGVPVVTSKYLGSGRENVLHHDQNCLMFDVGDCTAAARQLSRLAGSEKLRRSIAENGRSTTQEYYSQEVSIDQWDAVLRTIREQDVCRGMPSLSTCASGRLDRLVGSRLAETIRTYLRPLPMDTGPGGEWPHTISGCPYDDPSFWDLAKRLDERTESARPQPAAASLC